MFLRRFLRDPKNVASVWPSSSVLARAMMKGVDLRDGDCVVEYGPGTGAFTRWVKNALDGIDGGAYLGVEGDAQFHKLLGERFPDLSFAHGRVEDPAVWPADLKAPRLIVSGLPLITFPVDVLERILHETYARLASGGSFRTFSYVHSIPTAGQKRLRRMMAEIFDTFEVSKPIARNLPPAIVISGGKG